MKHDWIRDESGKVVRFGDEYPAAECRLCDHIVDWPIRERSDTDDCPGVPLNVVVTVDIRHPGKATEYRDRSGASMRKEIPLSELLDAVSDPVLDSLANMVEVISGGWRGARTAHESDWRAAVAAAPSGEGKAEGSGS